jgi:hypothetical protein
MGSGNRSFMETIFELVDGCLEKVGLVRLSSVRELRDELACLKTTSGELARHVDELSVRIDRLGS